MHARVLDGWRKQGDGVADSANIVVVDAKLRKALDTITKGASTSFLDGARKILTPVMREVRAISPRDTGKFEASWEFQERVTHDTLSVSIVNEMKGGRFVHWSVRTESSLDAEARRVSEELRPGLPLVARMLEPFIRADLTHSHGKGAPDATLAGKFVFTEVRRRGVRLTRRFVEIQEANLLALAGREI